jgi:hypothetical protein
VSRARKRRPVRGPGVHPPVIAVAVVEVVAIVEEADAVAVVVRGSTRLAGVGTQITTAAENWAIGLRTAKASSPRKARLCSRPRRRSPFFSQRSTPSRRNQLESECRGGGSVDLWRAASSEEKSAPAGRNETIMATQKQLVTKKREIHIVEEKVFVVLGNEAKGDSCRWVLDTGASNHMSGCQAVFSSIDDGTVGTIKFADGSVVNIEGVGIILYKCKNGEHHTLTNVYFIPILTTSIISVGQLDEFEFEIHIRGGIMLVRDEEQRLLARVHRGAGRLSDCN